MTIPDWDEIKAWAEFHEKVKIIIERAENSKLLFSEQVCLYFDCLEVFDGLEWTNEVWQKEAEALEEEWLTQVVERLLNDCLNSMSWFTYTLIPGFKYKNLEKLSEVDGKEKAKEIKTFLIGRCSRFKNDCCAKMDTKKFH